jgi:release factor glutamine methyltransferase
VAVAAQASAREALGAAADAFAAAGIGDARFDAEVLLAEALGTDRATLAADLRAEVPPAAARLFGEMVRRRLRREPVAYILGRRGFRRIELAVDRRVLIPRPETELLVELAVERQPRTLLDVGTGSGAIALAVADELPECEVTAADTSAAALEVARANAEGLGLADRVRFVAGTLPEGEVFDLVLANLPYVAENERPSLQPEVTEWEPPDALFAGSDGLDSYRTLFDDPPADARGVRPSSPCRLEKTNAIAVEVGEGQAGAVAELMRAAGFERTETRLDLAGIERVVVGER